MEKKRERGGEGVREDNERMGEEMREGVWS